MSYRARALVLAGLFALWGHSQLWSQRIQLDPGRLLNQILWTAAEEAKLQELGKVETSHRDILSKETAWRQAVGPAVPNTVPASSVAAPAAARSVGETLLATLAGSDTPYGNYAAADIAWRGATAALDVQARAFAGDGRGLDLSEWQHVRQQTAAQTNQALLVKAASTDEAARAKVLLSVQVTQQRVHAVESARAKNILRADFPP